MVQQLDGDTHIFGWLLAVTIATAPAPAFAQESRSAGAGGASAYRQACAACHGADGRGEDRALVMFREELPDFTDCSFASREPVADWVAVAHEGGPLRGFSRMMPAFGAAMGEQDIERIVQYIKSLCRDSSWPGGELNLPRPLFTEKAYPEDEWVLETVSSLNKPAWFVHTLVYEKRFGARSQLEIALPFGYRRIADGLSGERWATGVGDIALGIKHAFTHSVESGQILSAVAELKLPTGSESKGFGTGAKAAEAFVAYARLLPSDAFLQLQAGAERSLTGHAETEIFWSAVLGRTFTQGKWGRAWSPMLEVLGVREDREGVLWDVAPQLHVSLNKRQHVMLTLGPRIPLTGSGRVASFSVNLLWDWFDGGLFAGW